VSVILLFVATVLLAWLAWISFQSLLQGGLLREAAAEGIPRLEEGRRVALCGEVLLRESIRKPGRVDLLWYRHKAEELRGWTFLNRFTNMLNWNKNRAHWVTIEDVQEMATFGINVGGREIRVEGLPTEIPTKHKETENPGGEWLGAFHATGDSRVVVEYLPVVPRLTIVGRLERRGEDWVVVKDSKVGLVLSSDDPAQAASWEITKAVLGLLAVTAAVTVGLIIFFSLQR